MSQRLNLPMLLAEPPSLLHRLPSILDRIDPVQLFQAPRPLEIELGSGDGSFLVEYAHSHHERNFIGVERLLGRIRKMARKGQRAGLTNLRGIRIESSYFLEYLLPAHSATALHIYFPDPWPKRKHWRHRLINERFRALAHRALAAGGRVYLRTDDREYFERMEAVFNRCVSFHPVATPDELARLPTDFERDFAARGAQTLRAAYEAR